MACTVKIYGDKNPYPWQSQVHGYISGYLRRPEKVAETIIIKAARQRFGKSSFTKAELIRFCLSIPGSENAYVTPKLNLARKMLKEIVKACNPLIESSNMIDMIVIFKNKSQIRFHSEQQGEALRGFTVTGLLVIDEGSSFKDTTFYEFIAPWCTVHKALTLIISTPKYKMGFFYESYIEGIQNKNPYYITFDWVQNHNVPISPEDQSKRNKMPVLKWKSEYEGIFLDAEGTVFGNFAPCLIDELKTPYNDLYLGLDFGTGAGKDYTVLSGFDENGNQRILWYVNDLSPLEQVDRIAGILQPLKPKIKGIIGEGNSIGKIYLDAFRKKGIIIHEFTTTNDSKRQLVEDFQVSLNNKTVGLIKNQEQAQQLSFYESKVDPHTNKVTYNAPAGFHDDIVMSVLLAHKAWRQKQRKFEFKIY